MVQRVCQLIFDNDGCQILGSYRKYKLLINLACFRMTFLERGFRSSRLVWFMWKSLAKVHVPRLQRQMENALLTALVVWACLVIFMHLRRVNRF